MVPWAEPVALTEPRTPKAGPRGGRLAFATETMLRIRLPSSGSPCRDPTMEEALYDVPLYRQFARLDIGANHLPDESTILRFRHLLEQNGLAARMFDVVGGILAFKGLPLKADRRSMPSSLLRPVPPRTAGVRVTRGCAKPRRATSGTSG